MNSRILYRNILMLGQLDSLISGCSREKIGICLLKGAALIYEGLYEEWERDMEDVDILVRGRDFKRLDALLAAMGYEKVASGETGYHKPGENALIDVHVDDILFAGPAELEKVWKNMKKAGGARVMGREDHLIYIMCHGIIHHAGAFGAWEEDARRIISGGLDGEELARRVHGYGLREVFYIGMKKIGLPVSGIGHNTLKRKYIETMISLPYYEEKGHLLRPVLKKGLMEQAKFIKKFFFPDIRFLERRYRVRPAVLMLFIRPFLLFLKMLQGAFLLNPCKGGLKAQVSRT